MSIYIIEMVNFPTDVYFVCNIYAYEVNKIKKYIKLVDTNYIKEVHNVLQKHRRAGCVDVVSIRRQGTSRMNYGEDIMNTDGMRTDRKIRTI